MTDLTEQWQKGELPEGWYYVKDENGVIYPAENCLNYDSLSDKGYTAFYYAETEISEILALVPTYQKYHALQSDSLAKNEGAEIVAELKAKVKQLKNGYKDLAYKFRSYQDFNDLETLRLEEENAKLKELLKVCRKWIGVERDFAVPNEKIILQQLLTKIDEELDK